MKQLSGLTMTQNLNNFLTNAKNKKYATQHGTRTHSLLQNIIIDDVNGNQGDEHIISIIQNTPELPYYFSASAKTEVPIAGFINGVFISRRIDRLVIDTNSKIINFIDYKTDTDSRIFYDKYKKQLIEYAQLLHSAYPKYTISGSVLWLQDWHIEKIITL
jgi:hypothetical protein